LKFYPETKPLKSHVMNAEKLLLYRFALSASGKEEDGCANLVLKIMNAVKRCFSL